MFRTSINISLLSPTFLPQSFLNLNFSININLPTKVIYVNTNNIPFTDADDGADDALFIEAREADDFALVEVDDAVEDFLPHYLPLEVCEAPLSEGKVVTDTDEIANKSSQCEHERVEDCATCAWGVENWE